MLGVRYWVLGRRGEPLYNYELIIRYWVLGVRCWVLGIKMFVGANTCVRSYS